MRTKLRSDHERDRVSVLRRRAARFLRQRAPRKAALALREASALDPSGSSYVRLAHALMAAGRSDDALQALKQALYCFRHDEMRGRARTVARLILQLDPDDLVAQRRAA